MGLLLRLVHVLDTAAVYGDSEERLGRIRVADWQVVSKLWLVPGAIADPLLVGAVAQVHESLGRLDSNRCMDCCFTGPPICWRRMGRGCSRRCSVSRPTGWRASVSPWNSAPASELDVLCQRFEFDLVQAPFNILDRRLATSGWLAKLAAMGTEVHVRSVFLQGLLLMPRGDAAAGILAVGPAAGRL